jgi:AhpC/TSA family
MRVSKILLFSAGCVLAGCTVLTGCTSGSGDPVEPIPCDPETQECQYETVAGLNYPDGPFGTSIGDVIEPFSFNGYVNPSLGIGESRRALIELSAFYNPTGEDVYPEGSPFGEGEPKPLVVMVNVAAVWCQPCKEEAAVVLPAEYAKFSPQGMELVSILTDSADPGTPASFTDLDNWVSSFGSKYPSTIDPAYKVGSLIDTTQYPANFLIDTSDMTISEVVIGKPTAGFFTKLEALLD